MKQGIGTAVSGRSRVWFSIAHGKITEVYYPNVDQANIRDLELLVTNRKDFFSDSIQRYHT